MKRIQLYLPIILIIASHFNSFGQLDIGIKINGGASYIYTHFQQSNQAFVLGGNVSTDKNYYRPSGQAGLFFNRYLKHQFSIGAELLYTQIEGREYMELQQTNQNGMPGQYITDNVWRHISYLGIPIYFGYNFKRLNINIGFQFNYVLASGGEEKGQEPNNGNVTIWDNKFNELGIKNYDFGAKGGLVFKLSDKFLIEANYYYGLNNIIKDKDYAKVTKWQVQQMTIGLRYEYVSLDNHKDEKENYGQFDIGLKLNGGISYIYTKYQDSYQSNLFGGNITDKDYLQPSVQAGLFFNLRLPHKFSFGWELLYLEINGKEHYILQLTNQNATVSGQYISDNIIRHISYLGIPLYVGYYYKKFNINLGFQLNYALASAGKINEQPYYASAQALRNNNNKIGNTDFDFGARIGLIYKLTGRFSIEANYYYGMTNVIRDNNNIVKWQIQQLTIGLRYKFVSFSRH